MVSPVAAYDPSPHVSKAEPQVLFKTIATNEVLRSSKEHKDNYNQKTKEGVIMIAAKESLKNQHVLKMAVSVEGT